MRTEVVRMFADGDYVFLHTREMPAAGGEPIVNMELIRAGDPRLGVGRHFVSTPARTRVNQDPTMIGGGREVTDLEATRINKSRVRMFIRDILVSNRFQLFEEYIDPANFYSHNPRIGGDGDAFLELLRQEASCDQPLFYPRAQKIVGQGNFVAAFMHIKFRGAPYAACDLFRLEGGMIVEHWDVAEPLSSYLGG